MPKLLHCHTPHAENCTAILSHRSEVFSALRKALKGNGNEKTFAAVALSECGTEHEIPLLEDIRHEWQAVNPETKMETINKEDELRVIDHAIEMIRSRSRHR